MRVNNSGNDIESRVDATRVNVDDVINELVASNLTQPNENIDGEDIEPEECGLQLYVSKDGTATLGSRSGTNQKNKNKALPKTNHHKHHQSSNNDTIKQDQDHPTTDLLLMQPEPSSQNGSRQSLNDARCGE